jgi:hypothetical protein
MNLTNKQITVTTMETNAFPEKTTATVVITTMIAEGIYKQLDTFKMEFDVAYNSLVDPAMLNAIQEKLLEIPE